MEMKNLHGGYKGSEGGHLEHGVVIGILSGLFSKLFGVGNKSSVLIGSIAGVSSYSYMKKHGHNWSSEKSNKNNYDNEQDFFGL